MIIVQSMNVLSKEIYFLEHTHLFQECQSLYTEMAEYNAYQGSWFEKKKKETFPVKLKFGLEVCYSPEHEKDIEKIKSLYSFDFWQDLFTLLMVGHLAT